MDRHPHRAPRRKRLGQARLPEAGFAAQLQQRQSVRGAQAGLRQRGGAGSLGLALAAGAVQGLGLGPGGGRGVGCPQRQACFALGALDVGG